MNQFEELTMSKFIKTFPLVLLVLLTGCAGTGSYNQPVYSQVSPMIATVKNSGYTSNDKRQPGSVRYDEYTTLGSNMKQAGEVMITVTFDFQQQRNGEPRTGNCFLRIKSSDTPLFSDKRCQITPSAGTFIVSFRTKEYGQQSFDLYSLGGHFVGVEPPYRSGLFYFYVGNPHRRGNFRYDYVGRDPFSH